MKYKINTQEGHQGVIDTDEGNQGEYNERFIYYKHPEFPEGVFMRETLHSDSYGYDHALVAVDFVKGVAKTITVYEPI